MLGDRKWEAPFPQRNWGAFPKEWIRSRPEWKVISATLVIDSRRCDTVVATN